MFRGAYTMEVGTLSKEEEEKSASPRLYSTQPPTFGTRACYVQTRTRSELVVLACYFTPFEDRSLEPNH